MNQLTQIDYHSPAWASLPGDHRAELQTLLTQFRSAPASGIVAWLKQIAHESSSSYPTVRRKFYTWQSSGQDWKSIIDTRRLGTHGESNSIAASASRSQLPRFAAYLAELVGQYQRKNAPAFRELHRRWRIRDSIIPGYEDWAGWPKTPHGWSSRNLQRIVKKELTASALRSIRVGTSSKTNPFTTHILTTRVGLHPGAVIQIDDVWHDNLVTFGKSRKPVRVLELGALDLYSACRFHFGAMPRLRNAADTGYETIGGSHMRLFLAGLLHKTGYSPLGTSFMSEHATAKISEDIARILYDSSRGLIRVDYQPIEGKQAALTGFWNGTEGGNFRAKACLESTHNLMHNDLSALPMQTGSPSSGLQGPVTTDRILKYINGILRDVAKKNPHRLELLKLPTWDYHTQFVPFLFDYYDLGLNSRTEHNLEGWERLGHVINEYTTTPDGQNYISEQQFLTLPETSRAIISAAAQQDPQSWTRRRNLSPKEVWDRRPDFLPIDPTVLIGILGSDLAREATCRRGFIEFSDQEISPDPLIYQARFTQGPRAGKEIPHGEKCTLLVMPFDDEAIVVDAHQRYLGKLALYKRVATVDPAAFHTAAPFDQRPDLRPDEFLRAVGEKHARIADDLEPIRIQQSAKVAQAKDLRAHNTRVINGDPITPAEIATARTAAGQQAHRTAAANRLQAHGTPQDWDTPAEAPATTAAWDTLPDDDDLPAPL